MSNKFKNPDSGKFFTRRERLARWIDSHINILLTLSRYLLFVTVLLSVAFGAVIIVSAVNGKSDKDIVVGPTDDGSKSDPVILDNDLKMGYLNTSKFMFVWGATSGDAKSITLVPNQALIRNQQNTATKLLQFCIDHQISEVFLYIGCIEWEYKTYFKQSLLPQEVYLEKLTTECENKGIKLSLLAYLNDDPNDMTNFSRITSVLRSIYTFNQKFNSHILGLAIDVEPDIESNYVDLVSMYSLLNQSNSLLANEFNSTKIQITSVIKPSWIDTFVYDTEATLLSTKLGSFTDTSILMGYTTQNDKFNTYVTAFNKSCGSPKCRIMVETGWKNAASSATWKEVIFSNITDWFSTFRNLASSTSQQNLEIGIHEWAQYYHGVYRINPWEDKANRTNTLHY